ncbi:MAG: hypothetical protein HRT47_12345 [Candidatus Caenarcaniphilales bacterium]|nr:hypothetical protein [Candidatus Caenarcaniphilales bacterium]
MDQDNTIQLSNNSFAHKPAFPIPVIKKNISNEPSRKDNIYYHMWLTRLHNPPPLIYDSYKDWNSIENPDPRIKPKVEQILNTVSDEDGIIMLKKFQTFINSKISHLPQPDRNAKNIKSYLDFVLGIDGIGEKLYTSFIEKLSQKNPQMLNTNYFKKLFSELFLDREKEGFELLKKLKLINNKQS